MKKLLLNRLFLFITSVTLLSYSSCSKDDDDASPSAVDLLPPATQTGANTVGALLNGEAFLPKGGGIGGNKLCYYQFVDGGYHFLVRFSDLTGGGSRSIVVGTQHAVIEEGEIYILNSRPFFANNGNGRGGGFSNIHLPFEDYYATNNQITGELTITKLDYQNSIVSGTFWFDAVNEEGEVVEVREGRFDMQFTQ